MGVVVCFGGIGGLPLASVTQGLCYLVWRSRIQLVRLDFCWLLQH